MRQIMVVLSLLTFLTYGPIASAEGSVTFTVTNITYSEGNSYASVSYTLTQGTPNPDGCGSSSYFLLA